MLSKIRHLVIIFSILVNFISADHLSAKIYKWTDENGKIHFSDKPINKNAKIVKEKKKLSEAYLHDSRKQAQKLISFQKRMEQSRNEQDLSDKTKKSEAKNMQKKLKAQCAEIKRDVRVLGKGRPTYYTNEKGKQVFLSDKEKNASIEKNKAFIRDNCNFN